MSANSESAFQAISGAYAWLAVLGFVSMLVAFALPWMCAQALSSIYAGRPARDAQPHYWLPLVALALAHGTLAFFAVRQTVARMEVLRREERRKPRKTTGALKPAVRWKPAAMEPQNVRPAHWKG